VHCAAQAAHKQYAEGIGVDEMLSDKSAHVQVPNFAGGPRK